MQKTINRNLLQYAVQRAITCPRCQAILDMRDAVSLTLTASPEGSGLIPQREYVVCCKCWDDVRLAMFDLAASIPGGNLDVLDAREVFPPTLAQAKRTLAALGVTLKYSRDLAEYSVNLRGGTEATCYYTSDLLDAIGTGKAMAAHRTAKGGK